MKQLTLVANWKEHMVDISLWTQQLQLVTSADKTVVVCPPFTQLSALKQEIEQKHLSFKLGAQDVSQFSQGAHTGEEGATMLKALVEYVIIGHSERRAAGDTEEIVQAKVEQALTVGLQPIVCVSNQSQVAELQLDDTGKKVCHIAYEPLDAIGSGNPATPEHADEFAVMIREKLGIPVLYGGSVTAQNVHSFTQMNHISGVLVGGASLDARSFSEIVQNA